MLILRTIMKKKPTTILWDLDIISGMLFSLIRSRAITFSLNRNLL